MKKTVLITLFTALGLGASQTKLFAQKPMAGIHLGATMDQTIGTDLKGSFSGTFMAGAYGGLRFHKVGVHAELNFSQSTITTGDNFKAAFGNYLSANAVNVKNGTFKLNELSIPILVSFNIVKGLWVEAGPQYTAVVSIQDKNELLKATSDVFKSGYISGAAGLWLDLPFHLKVSGRYIFGITDRNKTTVQQDWRTGQIQLAVGYRFL